MAQKLTEDPLKTTISKPILVFKGLYWCRCSIIGTHFAVASERFLYILSYCWEHTENCGDHREGIVNTCKEPTSPDVSRIAVARPRRWVCQPAIASLLAQARRAGHRETAGSWSRGVPERYVAGCDTRRRPGGRPYPWSQQAIREASGLGYHGGTLVSQRAHLSSASSITIKSRGWKYI